MNVPSRWITSYEFACHSKACAPPPVGAGGSSRGSGRRIVQPGEVSLGDRIVVTEAHKKGSMALRVTNLTPLASGSVAAHGPKLSTKDTNVQLGNKTTSLILSKRKTIEVVA